MVIRGVVGGESEKIRRDSLVTDERNDLNELTQEIQKIIADNRRFLERVRDEDFEPEADEVPEEEIVEEL